MVRGLPKYIAQHTDANILCKVNIKQEIENFRRKNPDIKNPVIIFDFIATMTVLHRSVKEVICAGRQNECTWRAETFLKKLQNFGVEMVFFLEGPMQEEKIHNWIEKKNQQYTKMEKSLFPNLKAQIPLKYRFSNCLKTYYENYLRVARKYGRIFIALENECDHDLATYANRIKPVAILADDTDFMIMPGNWPIWMPSTLNVRDMTVTLQDKYKLWDSLGLQQWQMGIFATLRGNFWTVVKLSVENIGISLKPNWVEMFKALAGFIRQTFVDRKDRKKILVDLIYEQGNHELSYLELEQKVKLSLDFYDNVSSESVSEIPEWLQGHMNETFNSYVYMLFKQKTIVLSQDYLDMSEARGRPYADLVVPLFCRSLGIMYNNRKEEYRDFRQRICLKPSEKEPFCVREYSPIYPDFEIPAIDVILSNDKVVSLEKRAEILAWLASPRGKKVSTNHVLNLLKTIFIVPALVLNYLVQEDQITVDEADIILLTISETSKMDKSRSYSLRCPDRITEYPFYLAHLYTNLVYHFDHAMLLCGLYTFVPHSYFDGYLFHTIYQSFDGKLEITKSILNYRLYAQ